MNNIKKEGCPKFLGFNFFNVLIEIITILAWLFVDIKVEWKIYIISLIIVILLVVNIIIYCNNVRKFYKKYEELYKHDNEIQLLYQENRKESDNLREYNNFLKLFSKDTLNLLYCYNDCDEEKRREIREMIINNLFDGNIRKDDKNEKGI